MTDICIFSSVFLYWIERIILRIRLNFFLDFLATNNYGNEIISRKSKENSLVACVCQRKEFRSFLVNIHNSVWMNRESLDREREFEFLQNFFISYTLYCTFSITFSYFIYIRVCTTTTSNDGKNCVTKSKSVFLPFHSLQSTNFFFAVVTFMNYFALDFWENCNEKSIRIECTMFSVVILLLLLLHRWPFECIHKEPIILEFSTSVHVTV